MREAVSVFIFKGDNIPGGGKRRELQNEECKEKVRLRW